MKLVRCVYEMGGHEICCEFFKPTFGCKSCTCKRIVLHENSYALVSNGPDGVLRVIIMISDVGEVVLIWTSLADDYLFRDL